YQRMARTVKAPKTPLVKPPEVVRVLVLHSSDPHQAGAPLYGQRYIHFLGSDPEWVLGRPLPEPDDALSTWE
ncbi:MAG: TraV family lipoprotein, partial [Gammaproteobacteria bacterium]